MNTAMRNSEEDRPPDIAPDGGIILIVGEENVRLKVYSAHLRSASKVFSAMFGPDWNAGQSASKDTPIEFPLPEDDADAMRTICCVVHHRNNLIPKSLAAKEVLQIAIAVDKYDLTTALMFAASEWLKPDPSKSLEDKGRLLAAAYLFENTEGFMAHSQMLILDHCESYLCLAGDDSISRILPHETFHMLEECRTRLRLKLYEELTCAGRAEICPCGWGRVQREVIQEVLFDNSPTTMLQSSISDIITLVERAIPTEKTGASRNRPCIVLSTHTHKHFHEPGEYSETLPGRLNELKGEAAFSIELDHNTDSPEA